MPWRHAALETAVESAHEILDFRLVAAADGPRRPRAPKSSGGRGLANGRGSRYEQVVGRLHFAVDPKNPRNAVIADIDKAPRNAQGLVEFVADFALQRPVSGGNGAALIDVVNRGGTTALRLNRSARPGDTADDGLLRKMGITVMAVGWEFDVPVRNGAIRIDVPVATDNGKPITGIVRATFTP